MSKLKVDQISIATGAAPAIFTLPAADGTAGQLMKTDGSGNLGFVSSAVGGKIGQVVQTTKNAYFLSNIPKASICDLTCLNFLSLHVVCLFLLSYRILQKFIFVVQKQFMI